MSFRIEHDLIGDEQVPEDAYYGIQTMRGLLSRSGVFSSFSATTNDALTQSSHSVLFLLKPTT